MFVGRFLERLQREAASTAEDDDVVADDDEQVALLQDASDEDDADEGNADDGENDVEDGDAVEDPEEEAVLEEEIPWWLAVCNLETLKTPAVYFALVSTNPRAPERVRPKSRQPLSELHVAPHWPFVCANALRVRRGRS